MDPLMLMLMDGDAGVDDPPGIPTNLSLDSGQTTITATWTDPADLDLAGVKVQYKASASGTWLDWETVAAGAQTSTITGLTASTSYDVQIIAVDDAAQESDPTDPETIETEAEAAGSGSDLIELRVYRTDRVQRTIRF